MHGTAWTPHPTATDRKDDISLLVALELSRSTWLLAAGARHDDKIRKHPVDAGDSAALLTLLSRLSAEAQRRRGRPVKTISIHKDGLDEFWGHRLLAANGVERHVVDAASIAVNRRHRRVKRDRTGIDTLLRASTASARGKRQVCSMLRPPSREERLLTASGDRCRTP
jgi:transposase